MDSNQTHPGDIVCYHPKRSTLIQGIAFGLIFLTFGIVSSWAALTNAGGTIRYPVTIGICFLMFWMSWVGLSVYVIISYFRERLILTASGLIQQGVFRIRSLAWTEVQSIQWRTLPRKCITILRGPDYKLTIDLNSFSSAQKQEIIQTIRSSVPEALQRNENRVTTFLDSHVEPSENVVRERKRLTVLLMVLLWAFVAIFAASAAMGLGMQFAVLSAINAVVAIVWMATNYQHRRHPKTNS